MGDWVPPELTQWMPVLSVFAPILVGTIVGVFKMQAAGYEKQIDRLTVDRDKWQLLALQGLQLGEHATKVAEQLSSADSGVHKP